MEVVIDPDVKAVAEFMQSGIETRKLVGVTESLRAIAPILWGHYGSKPVIGIELAPETITCESRSVATGSAQPDSRAGGDSAAVAVAL
jgi:hypothetical protein